MRKMKKMTKIMTKAMIKIMTMTLTMTLAMAMRSLYQSEMFPIVGDTNSSEDGVR